MEATVALLEDDPLFNAGRGSVLNAEGGCDFEASIMDGRGLRAGAVIGVRGVRNPVRLARAVMEKSGHVILAGQGAEAFARQQGLAFAPEEYFITEVRRQQWLRGQRERPAEESGTVGAVALDAQGHLAAACSTGGVPHKRPGRVGDSGVIGAGIYAEDRSCAVACTGWGEYFLRAVAARSVAALVERGRWPLRRACEEVLYRRVGGLAPNAQGGIIAVDRRGDFCLLFSSAAMARGSVDEGGEVRTALLPE